MKQEILQHYHWQEVSNQPQGSISDTSNWVKEFCAAESPSFYKRFDASMMPEWPTLYHKSVLKIKGRQQARAAKRKELLNLHVSQINAVLRDT